MKKLPLFLTVAATATVFSALPSVASADTGKFAGTWSGYQNSLDISPSLTADTLYGYNNGCSYGKFSHVAMAYEGSYYSGGVWDGRVIESTNVGTASGANSVYTNHWQSHFHKYDAASLDYFSKSGYSFPSTTIKNKAASYSGVYDWSSSFSDNSSWYCSKLVSRAVYDVNGYNLGFLIWGSFIAPGDVWDDSAVVQRTHAVSSHYDGGSVWAASMAMTANSTMTAESIKAKAAPAGVTTFTYHGAKVTAKKLDAAAMKAVDDRIAAEKAAGKPATNLEITMGDSKPGLAQHAKEMIAQGKATPALAKAAWGLTDADLK